MKKKWKKKREKWKVESEFNRVSNTNLPASFSFLRDHLSPPPLFLLFHYIPCTFLFALRIQYEKISISSSILYRFESETTRPSMRVAHV